MKLEEFREQAQAYFQAEDAFMREVWWLPYDEVLRRMWEFSVHWGGPGFRMTWTELVSGDQSSFDQLRVRPLFRVESYEHPSLEVVFTAEVAAARQSLRRTSYSDRYLFTEGEQHLRLVSIESVCGDCHTLGKIEGRRCSTCGGVGWLHFGEGEKLSLGKRTGVIRVSDATSKRYLAANERP